MQVTNQDAIWAIFALTDAIEQWTIDGHDKYQIEAAERFLRALEESDNITIR